MAGEPNKTVAEPKMKDLLDLFLTQVLLSTNCHAIATVESFDETKQTVQASLNYLKTFDGKQQKYPVLVDCPLVVLTGGEACLTMPVSAGDTCVILFNDRDMDAWWSSGQVQQVNTPRMHAFSDAMALVGVRSLKNPISAYDTVRAVLRNGSTMVGVGPDKVKVSNALYTLNGLLQDLVTQAKALADATAVLTVTGVTAGPGVSLVPVNAASFAAASAQLTIVATKLGGLLE